MPTACEFCANCCCIIAGIGIIFYAILIGLIYNDNYYLLSQNHKAESRNAFLLAMLVLRINNEVAESGSNLPLLGLYLQNRQKQTEEER